MPTIALMGFGGISCGKSSFGNLLLNKNLFPINSTETSEFSGIVMKSENIKDLQIKYIDTPGISNDAEKNSQIFEKFQNFFSTFDNPINAIALLSNGNDPSLSQESKYLLKFFYNSFLDSDIFQYFCFILTHCPEETFTPDVCQEKEKLIRDQIVDYCKNELKISKDNIPNIPIFFVENTNKDDKNTSISVENLIRLVEDNSYFIPSKALNKNPYNEQIEIEYKNGVSQGFQTIDETVYELLVDKKRIKRIPSDGSPIKYGDWEIIKEYKVPIKTISYERENRVSLGIQSDGESKYELFVDRRRRIVKNLKTDEKEIGDWEIINQYREDPIQKKTLTRTRKEEEKVVDHQKKHSKAGFSSKDHTHYEIYNNQWDETCEEITNPDGTVSRTEWTMVEGTYTHTLSRSGRERGFTEGYKRFIE